MNGYAHKRGAAIGPEAAAPGGNPFGAYEAEKAAWLRLHPNATPDQVEAACVAIAERLGL